MKQIREFYAGYKPLLRNGNFLKVLFAGLISSIGSRIQYFALLRKVYVISNGSITNLGFLAMFQVIPGMLLGPFAGVIVDRSSRKRIMILSDLINAIIVLGLIFAKDLKLIYVVSCLSSVVSTFRYPAQTAMEPNLVKKNQIVLLNSFKASSNSFINVIGAAIGGATVGLFGVNRAFFANSITFVASALIIGTVFVVEQHLQNLQVTSGSRQALKQQWEQFKEGMSVLGNNINVRMVIIIDVFLTFAMSMQGTLIYYFLKQTLALGDYAESFWGYLLSALGVGGIVGSFIIGAALRNYPNRFKLFLNVLLFDAVVFSAFLMNRYLPLSLFLFGLLGIIAAASQILMNSILQEQVEDTKRGRVFSLRGIIAGPMSALSIFIGTVGAEYITARNVLLIAAGLELSIAVGLRFTSVYRKIANETEQPKSVPEPIVVAKSD